MGRFSQVKKFLMHRNKKLAKYRSGSRNALIHKK